MQALPNPRRINANLFPPLSLAGQACATSVAPFNINSQDTNAVKPTLVSGGRNIARAPATSISTLSKTDMKGNHDQ
jgi:hypothetical protein